VWPAWRWQAWTPLQPLHSRERRICDQPSKNRRWPMQVAKIFAPKPVVASGTTVAVWLTRRDRPVRKSQRLHDARVHDTRACRPRSVQHKSQPPDHERPKAVCSPVDSTMKKRRSCFVASWLGVLLFVSACSGNTPSGPDQVPSTTTTTIAPRSMTIDSLVPPPGNNVSIGRCGFFNPPTCTTSLRGTFNVTYDATVQQPIFRVSFLDAGGRQCLYELPTDLNPLAANQPKTYAASLLTIVTVNPLNGPYVCGSPINTTSIRLQLFDRTVNGPLLMENLVNAAYTWNP